MLKKKTNLWPLLLNRGTFFFTSKPVVNATNSSTLNLVPLLFSYITYLDENAPQGTALTFLDPYIPQVNDNDAGKNGVFSISLVGNNGTFEVSPTVAERHAQFIIKVRDNTMLDYEARKSVVFQVSNKS